MLVENRPVYGFWPMGGSDNLLLKDCKSDIWVKKKRRNESELLRQLGETQQPFSMLLEPYGA